MNSNPKVLEKFCCAWDPKYETPFYNRGFTYATNTHVLIRTIGRTVDRDLNYPDFPEEYIDNMFLTPKNSWHLLSQFRTDERSKPCEDCEGTGGGRVLKCPECEGFGTVEFDNGYHTYSPECKSCSGSGEIEHAQHCSTCDGTGEVSIRDLVEIDSLFFDNRYINQLIESLPENATISTTGSLTPAILSWSTGSGLLMPVRR